MSKVETDACHCRDGGGGSTDMRDCPTHLRECYGWPPVEGAKGHTSPDRAGDDGAWLFCPSCGEHLPTLEQRAKC